MIIFYRETKDVAKKERYWYTHVYFNNELYEVESYTLDMYNEDYENNIREQFYKSEHENFLQQWIQWMCISSFTKNYNLNNFPYYKKCKDIDRKVIIKISKHVNDGNVYYSGKSLDTKDFIYEFAYLNRNRYKYICFVNYNDFYHEIVGNAILNRQNYDNYDKQSYDLIQNFLKNNFSQEIFSNIYSNNSILLVSDENTLVQLKLYFGTTIYKIIEIENFVQLWSCARVTKKSPLYYNFIWVQPEMSLVHNLLKNAKKILLNARCEYCKPDMQ